MYLYAYLKYTVRIYSRALTLADCMANYSIIGDSTNNYQLLYSQYYKECVLLKLYFIILPLVPVETHIQNHLCLMCQLNIILAVCIDLMICM